MARKDVFANITSSANSGTERRATPGYATHGASRSMISSLSELREKVAQAEQQISGEAIIDLDPELLDSSFVADRIGADDLAYGELLEGIRERGQDTPIMVRPHPTADGRYQIVFGHRRARAAKELGRPVRAVVKPMSDADHIIAQGQENSARENLSFIERAMFAQKLLELSHEKPVIQVALSVDAPMLTRMLSVSSRVPADIANAIGPAKSVGRNRWTEFAQLIERPSSLELARTFISHATFSSLESDTRFERLLAEIKNASKPAKRPSNASEWRAEDSSVRAEFKGSGKSYSIALKANDAARFGRFITENLDRLHQEFLSSTKAEGK
ncbi:chromosome partitioning protein, ParB family [Rhizobium mongolense subsp. loessense]|uniref:Chromosome partitioning protein, ParB family n=1 Tax=Rhizobium mongolense subsp. loessense TaxID=158890 RepID=A0A1G4TQM7_9HYPH|nr:plasmid partitioning protein RepB [Rhizobium mongolense]NRP90467.1 putative chromosome-partitioning protein ParB [Ensifer adhaerens]SCW83658.1 chromosome partitioning protein, ParB family [Rhizobium mongolense subsp. loessense]